GNATEEKNVSDVSTKVASGAVDAGFIYSTDAAYLKKDQDITVIDLPGLEDNVYPMALTNLGKQNSVASDVKDLASESVTTAICAAEVPCGNLAHQELDKQHVELGNATEEKNVSDVSTKVASGAVDAGFIYSTDAA
ncbi:hypothetical protein BUE67_13560, partial [Corynebacterium diphtheriae]